MTKKAAKTEKLNDKMMENVVGGMITED